MLAGNFHSDVMLSRELLLSLEIFTTNQKHRDEISAIYPCAGYLLYPPKFQ